MKRRWAWRRCLVLLAAAALAAVPVLFFGGVPPAEAQDPTPSTLVSNAGQTAIGTSQSVNPNRVVALGFVTGSNSGGYTLSSIELGTILALNAANRAKLDVELWSSTAANKPNSYVADLTIPATVPAGTVSFAAPDDTTLSASTRYFVVVKYNLGGSSGFYAVTRTAATDEDSGGAAGWSIDDNIWSIASAPGDGDSGWSSFTPARIAKLTVKGFVKQAALPKISLASDESDGVVEESATDRVVVLTASVLAAPTSDVTVSLSVSGTGVTTGDYTLPASITIMSGSTSATASLTILNDAVDEDDETLKVTASATGYTPSDELSIQITDDDTAGVSVSETALSMRVGATATYTVKLNSEPTATVTVTPSVSPSAKATVTGAMTFTGGSSGNWATAQTVTVTGAEAGSATVSHAVTSSDTDYSSAASVAVTVTAASTPTVSLSASPNPVTEGTSVTVTATLSAALSSNVTIPVTVADVTAASGDRGTLASIVISANMTTGSGTITTATDSVVEADETFTVALGTLPSSVTAGTPSSVTVTIDDDDTPAAPGSLAAAAGGSGELDLSWTKPSGVLTGYVAQYTSAPTMGAGAVTNGAVASGTDASKGWVSGGTAGAGAEMHTIGSLTNDQAYRVRVRALSAAGDGAWAHASGTPVAPTLPAIMLAATDSSSMAVTSVAESAAATVRAVTLTASLASNATSAVTVNLSVGGMGVTSGDYTLSGTQITISSGTKTGTATVTLTVVDDDIDEADTETLVVTASDAAVTPAYSDGKVEISVTDDDAAGVTVSESTRTVEVGETTTYTVVLDSEPTANVTVAASSSAVGKATVSPASYVFTSSNWSTAKTFTVEGKATGAPKAVISHSVTSTDAKYSSLTPDSVTVTVNASTKTYKIDYTGPTAEGADASLTVTLGRAPTAAAGQELSVTYSYSGSTATTADTGTTPTSVTVARNMNTATLTVPIAQDNLVEGAESFTVTVGAPAAGWAVPSGASATATVTISDDETANAKIAFGSTAGATAVHADSAAENKTSPATVLVPVTVSARPQTSTAFSITAAGTATGGAAGDYTAPASVTFGPADTAETDGSVTKNVTITLRNDSVVEFDETVELQIAAARASSHMDYDLGDRYVRHASGSKATVTIEDDEADAGPTIAFGSSAAATAEYEASKAEDGGTLLVPVTISALPGASTTFGVEVLSAGTATQYDAGPPEAVGDFRIAMKSVTFGPTGSMTKNLSIALEDDALVEAAQTVKLRLAAARADTHMDYGVGDLYARDAVGQNDDDGASSVATLTITDDDAADAKIAFGSSAGSTAKHTANIAENASPSTLSVPVTVSHLPEAATTFTVTVAGTATEGADYSVAPKTLTFSAASATTQNLTVTVSDDELVEHDQTVELDIASGTGSFGLYTRDAQGRLAQVTIGDDEQDKAKIVIGTAVPAVGDTPVQYTATAAEGDGTLAVPVRVSHLPESAVSFTVEVVDAGTTARDSADPGNMEGNPKDYGFAATTVGFDDTADAFSKDLTIDIADDDVEEDNETIEFKIAAARAVGHAEHDEGDYYERVTDASTALVTLTSDDQVASVTLSLSGVTATPTGWYPVLEGTSVTVTATADIPVGPGGWSVSVSNPTLGLYSGFVRDQCADADQVDGWACPNDYGLPADFTIDEGKKSETATLTLVSDSYDETREERMSLAAVASRGARKVAAGRLDLRIRQNASGISIDPPSAVLIPGETATYTVALSGTTAPTGDVTVTPASGDTDKATVGACASVDPCVLTFTSANWQDPQTVTVTAVAAGDVKIAHATASADTAWNQLNGLGGFSVKVNAARNIYRVDPPRDPPAEGATAELTITLGALAPTGGLTFTVDRSRSHDLEYLDGNARTRDPEAGLADPAADLTSPPATVTVLEGERTATLSDPIADDDLAEGDEHYYVVISTATAGWTRETGETATVSRTCAQDAACARVGIADGDTAGLAVAFGDTATSITAHTAAAGESAGTVTVPVTVSALPAAEIAFDIEVLSTGTATLDTDYTIAAKSVTFGPTDASTTKNLDITITDDSLAEGDETIRLRIAAADDPVNDLGDSYVRHQNGAQATVTITDNDGAVEVSTAEVTVKTGAAQTYTVRLEGAQPASAVTIDVAVASGGTDKATVLPAQLTFDSTNWQQPQTVTVTGVAEGTATITHTVDSGSDAAYRSLTVASVTVTVTALPTASISVSPNPVDETAAATVTVTLSEALAQRVTIPIKVAVPDTGSDRAEDGDWTPPAAVTIEAGQTRGTTRLATRRDTDTDDDKVDISLDTLPAGLARGTPDSVTLTITDTGAGTPPPSVNVGGPGPRGGGGAPGGGSGSGDDQDAREPERLWGADRYATSLEVAREVAAAADGKLTTIVLAGGHSWTDALTAGPLAGALDAALLLTAPDGLAAGTIQWIKELGATEIIAVGSTEHITDKALEALADIDPDIERITADDAEATAVAVARRVGRPETLGPLLGRTVIVASSAVFADALAAGPLAAKGPHPILLTDKDELHPHTAAYLAEHADHVVVMGGTAAITTDVEEQIRAIAQANRAGDRPMAITRLGGTDRYDTSVKFARWLASPALQGRVCFTTDTVGLATGANPADAAASAPLLARRCAPLVLTRPDRLPTIVASYLRRAGELIVFGGAKAINQTALDDWTR